uniref:F-box domain-containing protein n=1 Tax=Panagrellus redivivus TaxID=6233 RepID=A0A7E4ZXM3_PANRE
MRRVRFHPATFFNDSVDCLEPYPGLDPPYLNYDHCVYPVGTSTFRYSKVLLQDLPSEIILNVLLLLEPKDVRNVSKTCKLMNSFVRTYFQSVPREKIQKLVIQSLPEEKELPSIIRQLSMVEKYPNVNALLSEATKYHLGKAQRRNYHLSFHRSIDNRAHLWQTMDYDDEKLLNIFKELDCPLRCQLAIGATIDLHDVVFTDAVLHTLKKTIFDMVVQGYPGYRTTQPFRLRLYGCTFTNTTKGTFKWFADSMIDAGMTDFHLNNVQFTDVKFICTELAKAKLNQLVLFRFHSTEIRSDRTESIARLFEPFYKNNRLTKKIIIDGFEMPLKLCSKLMINFCCTPFFTSVPPPLRVVMGIARKTTRDDLFNVLTEVRTSTMLDPRFDTASTMFSWNLASTTTNATHPW